LAAWAVRDAESEDDAESQDGAASNGDAKHSRIAAPAGGD